jgi:hypothetical protein
MRRIGFSTGAVARGDFRRALDLLRVEGIDVVELSALRISELEPLVSDIPYLDLRCFSFISVHAPSWFTIGNEQWVVDQLNSISGYGFPVVVHPDVIFTPKRWQHWGDRLLVENMDRRKPIGRNVRELRQVFDWLPEARFCFDIGHARQVDPSMTESSLLLGAFSDRLAEVHISEVNTASRHDPISPNAVIAFQSVAKHIPEEVPIVLEALIDKGQSEIQREVQRAREALSVVSFTAR